MARYARIRNELRPDNTLMVGQIGPVDRSIKRFVQFTGKPQEQRGQIRSLTESVDNGSSLACSASILMGQSCGNEKGNCPSNGLLNVVELPVNSAAGTAT